MLGEELRNAPLVEAILDLRWALKQGTSDGTRLDPNYPLLVGRFYELIRNDFPFHEELPAAQVPDQMVAYMAQHRFRKGPEAWPLIQLGPGLMTLNETDAYKWRSFRDKSIQAFQRLFDAHPEKSQIDVTRLVLRYINAIEFDYETEDIFQFLKENLKATVSLPEVLFKDSGVRKKPTEFNWQASFPCEQRHDFVTMRFGIGRRHEKPALLWEILVRRTSECSGIEAEAFAGWLDEAHGIAEDWFFKLIEGELKRRFSDGV